MKNCLVTKLKGTVNNDNLLPYGAFVFNVNSNEVISTGGVAFEIDSDETYYEIIGDGYFFMLSTGDNLGKIINFDTVNRTAGIYNKFGLSAGQYKVIAHGKYHMDKLLIQSDKITIATESIGGMPISDFACTAKFTTPDLTDIIKNYWSSSINRFQNWGSGSTIQSSALVGRKAVFYNIVDMSGSLADCISDKITEAIFTNCSFSGDLAEFIVNGQKVSPNLYIITLANCPNVVVRQTDIDTLTSLGVTVNATPNA